MENRKYNFNPYLWGKNGWIFLNYIALSFPKNPTNEEKKMYKDFFYSLQYVLPCESCSNNFKEHIKILPIDNYLKNSDSLYEWIIKIQNLLNTKLNKPLLNEKKLKKKYMNSNKKYFNINDKTKKILIFIGSIFSLFLIKKLLKINIKITYL